MHSLTETVRLGGGGGGANEARSVRGGGSAMHTQRGAYIRQSVATARVLLFKGGAGAGPCIEQSEPSVQRSELRCTMCVERVDGAHTRRCIRKAGHRQGGPWPPQESC